MNNRILKKLCKRVKELVEQNPHIQPKFWRTKDVWLDCEEPMFNAYLNPRHSWANRVTGVWVIGGECDYWGEATDPTPLFRAAQEIVYWEFGEPTWGEMKDDQGNVIDNVPGWPTYNRRLTGAEVVRLVRLMAGGARR